MTGAPARVRRAAAATRRTASEPLLSPGRVGAGPRAVVVPRLVKASAAMPRARRLHSESSRCTGSRGIARCANRGFWRVGRRSVRCRSRGITGGVGE